MGTTTNPPSSNSGSGFTNPTYAYNNDGVQFATSGSDGQVHSYGGYGFSIDAGATVSSVRINLRAKCATNDQIKVELSENGGSSWLATSSTPTITTTNADHWIDASAWTSWTPGKINSDNIWARVTHVKAGGADTVSIDYLPIEVTATMTTTKTSSVIFGDTVSASRVLGITKSSSNIFGNTVSASRGLTITKTASIIMAKAVSATKSLGIIRLASIILGKTSSASRQVGYTRRAGGARNQQVV